MAKALREVAPVLSPPSCAIALVIQQPGGGPPTLAERIRTTMADAAHKTAIQLQLSLAENEVAEAKSKLAAIRKQAADENAGVSTYDSSCPSPLRELPAELRNVIYELCLVVGKIHYSYGDRAMQLPHFDMRVTTPTQSPEVQLFRLCKQIYAEACKVYLSKNTFVILNYMCTSDEDDPPFVGLYRNKAEMQIICCLSISLDYRCLSRDYADNAVQSGMSFGLWTAMVGEAGDENCFTIDLHADMIDRLCIAWERLFNDLLMNDFKLDFLQVNVQNCYCGALSCCRLTKDAFHFDILKRCLPHLDLETLDIIGTEHCLERNMIRRLGEGKGAKKMTFHGVKYKPKRAEFYQWDPDVEIAVDDDKAEDESGEWLEKALGLADEDEGREDEDGGDSDNDEDETDEDIDDEDEAGGGAYTDD